MKERKLKGKEKEEGWINWFKEKWERKDSVGETLARTPPTIEGIEVNALEKDTYNNGNFLMWR